MFRRSQVFGILAAYTGDPVDEKVFLTPLLSGHLRRSESVWTSMRNPIILTVAAVLSVVSALTIPTREATNHDGTALATRHILNKRLWPNRPQYSLPSPSRICAAGAIETDPDTTHYLAVDDDQWETATWTRITGPQAADLRQRYVDSLESWILMNPGSFTSYIGPRWGNNLALTWRDPGGRLELTIEADEWMPVEVGHEVLSNWVNLMGTHRQQFDTAPAGIINIAPLDIRIILRPRTDGGNTDGSSPDEEDYEDSDDSEDSESETSPEPTATIYQALATANSSRFPVAQPTDFHYFDTYGNWGGPSEWNPRWMRKRRAFTVVEGLWEDWFGPKPQSISRPYLPGCHRKMMVVDVEKETERLQLGDLDLTTFATDDPREHEQLSLYLFKLQCLNATSSSLEKARAIASLLQLSDKPSAAMVKELRRDIDDCHHGSNTTARLQKRRPKPPAGLANERYEDDSSNHQLTKQEVFELLTNLRKNGLARVDASWQSFRVGKAYVSWSSKFSTSGFAPPSREEILPYVRAFYYRVSWGTTFGFGWWSKTWSTSYRDVLFGQKKMRLCISNRPNRCLK